jgi:hypothetical protein
MNQNQKMSSTLKFLTAILFLMTMANAIKTVDPRCQLGGCSKELCVLKGKTSSPVFGTCQIKDYFSCYENSYCAYSKGRCGWKGTSDLTICLTNKGADASVIGSLL